MFRKHHSNYLNSDVWNGFIFLFFISKCITKQKEHKKHHFTRKEEKPGELWFSLYFPPTWAISLDLGEYTDLDFQISRINTRSITVQLEQQLLKESAKSMSETAVMVPHLYPCEKYFHYKKAALLHQTCQWNTSINMKDF